MGNLIDLTDKKFGRLTVIKQNGRDKSKKIMWLCRCDCGNEKTVRGDDLRAGKVQSCGCLHKARMKEGYEKYLEKRRETPTFRKDLTGKVFGRLTVLEYDLETTKEKHQTTTSQSSWWKCKCECGNIISVESSSLTSEHTKSCGCLNRELASQMGKKFYQKAAQSHLIDLTGQVFYNLTVIKRSEKNTNGNKPQWVCQCKCGNIIEVAGDLLRRGETKSCGCLGNSIGQDIIRNILISNKISFQQEVKFKDLKDQSYLRFDFAILDDKNQVVKLIEYDGRQHSDPNSIWHTPSLLKHDNMKDEYCKINNIPLLRISYHKLKEITLEILLNEVGAI